VDDNYYDSRDSCSLRSTSPSIGKTRTTRGNDDSILIRVDTNNGRTPAG
jgi:hypothetical protein